MTGSEPEPRSFQDASTQPERLRLFVAISTPDSWRPRLQEECARLQAAAPEFGRWAASAGWHLTLAFLGYQPAAFVPAITAALESAASEHAPFTVRLGRPGCFRRGRHVDVVWVGLEDDPPGSLARLRAEVVKQLAAGQIEFDRVPFQAHLTLARARRDATVADCALIIAAIEDEQAWGADLESVCSEIHLFESDLRPTGAVYTVLHTARLAVVAK